jgi:hypothetical protein
MRLAAMLIRWSIAANEPPSSGPLDDHGTRRAMSFTGTQAPRRPGVRLVATPLGTTATGTGSRQPDRVPVVSKSIAAIGLTIQSFFHFEREIGPPNRVLLRRKTETWPMSRRLLPSVRAKVALGPMIDAASRDAEPLNHCGQRPASRSGGPGTRRRRPGPKHRACPAA